VKERHQEKSTYELNAVTDLEIKEWSSKNLIEPAVEAALTGLVDANRQRRDLATEVEHVHRYHTETKNEVSRVKESDIVVHKLTELLVRQEKDLHTRQEQEEDLEKKVKARKIEMKEFSEKNKMTPPTKPTSPAPAFGKKKEPEKKNPEEEAYEEYKKMEQRLQGDETRYTTLKRQNEEDTKLLNEMTTVLAQHKADIKVQVKEWDVTLTNAKDKVDLVTAKVDANRKAIEGLITTIVKTGGDRFLGPESERPKPKKDVDADQTKKEAILKLFET